MQPEFPYQIVTFLDKEPSVGEPVYYGENGWYPQLALKRRFSLNSIDEGELIKILKAFFVERKDTPISSGELVKPDRMPVRAIDITNQDELKGLHLELIGALGDSIRSRFPERDGENYYAHITAEYEGNLVIPVEEYANKRFAPTNIWLLKDIGDTNSKAYNKIR